MLEYITEASDSRLAYYSNLRDRHLRRHSRLFVAESELVVRRLLQSCLTVHSVLAISSHAEALANIRPDVPVLCGEHALLRGVVGFPFHRGVLALGERPQNVAIPDTLRRALIIEDITDVDNVGSLIRVAAAFGVELIMLSPRCADPYYRKALRAAVGTTFALPVVRAQMWPGDLLAMRDRFGLRLLSSVLDSSAMPLARVKRPERFALCVGSEGPGLTAELRAICDQAITIPMAPHADSLNVAVAAAVVLHHFC